MSKHPTKVLFAAVAVFGLLTTGCSTTTKSRAMIPATISAANRTSLPVQAVVAGGARTDPYGRSGITNETFREALESSLVQCGIFRSAGNGGYVVEAFIADIDQPVLGISMRVNLDISYALRRGGSTIWRKGIRSTYEAPYGAHFADAVRLRIATEGAARENIASLIRELDSLKL
jgi:hypothetical protein